jgi:hypothetical protein
VEKYPQTIPVFTSNGFSQMDDAEKREQFAKSISLKMALMLKQLDVKIFSNLLIEAIEQEDKNADATLAADKKSESKDALNVVGLLPCPVRIPLLEQFNNFTKEYTEKYKTEINHELKAASMGLEWVENNIKGIENADELPDLFISAGFDMFFDEDMIGKFKRAGVFEDTTKFEKFNSLF